MTWRIRFGPAAALALSVSTCASSSEPQSSEHVRWLDSVHELMFQEERALFLELPTDAERELFVEAFWERRAAPSAGSVSEFRDAYYRRLDEATRKFGRRSSRTEVTLAVGEPSSPW